MHFECLFLIFSEQGLDSIKLLPVAFAYFAYCAYCAYSANSKYSKDILWVGAWFNQVVAFPQTFWFLWAVAEKSFEQLRKTFGCGKLHQNCQNFVCILLSRGQKVLPLEMLTFLRTLRTYFISLEYCVVFSKSAIPLEISWKPYPNLAPTTVSNILRHIYKAESSNNVVSLNWRKYILVHKRFPSGQGRANKQD